MNDERKEWKSEGKLERRRLQKLAQEYRQRNGVEIPQGAVPADPSQQVPNNSYSPPPTYYVDTTFICVDCGQKSVWTAQQQKWYFEIAKGSLYARAVRCDECRQKHSKQHQGHGDPNPIKHVGSLMKRIRENLEPLLLEAEFKVDGISKFTDSRSTWIEYSRPDVIFRCLFEPREARLIAETMDDKAEYKIIANVELRTSHSTSGLLERVSVVMERIDEFTSMVRGYLRTLPVGSGAQAEGTQSAAVDGSNSDGLRVHPRGRI